jgi:1-acylglycerone phosphate reductase
LITGCGAGGIGAALAKEFHRRGCAVIATGRTTAETDPELLELSKSNGPISNGGAGSMHCFEFDVTDANSLSAAVRTFESLFPGRGLDILVNNAGICTASTFADTDVTDLMKLLNVNAIAPWVVTRAFLPLLRKAAQTDPSRTRQSLVVNLGSINSGLCPPFLSAYNASKAFVMAWSRTARRELSPFGIRVVVLKTGAVASALQANGMPLSSEVPPDSWYLGIKEYIESWQFMSSGTFMQPDVYARSVAPQLLRAQPRAVIWEGGLAWITWLVDRLGWETMLDSIMTRESGMHKLGSVGPEKKNE